MIPAAGSRDLALEFGLKASEFDLIIQRLGREPSLTELGMISVMWSEHCGYKYSRPILAYFKRYREAQEAGGMENAGIIPLGDGLGITFKVESHNHPSAVEPYQGAATGVGGILRDIFTMGARPIASLNSLRFGPLKAGKDTPEAVAQRNRFLLEHVVEGIGGYGNCVGVPTVGGEVAFHPRYSGNPLVNAMAVGLVKIDEIATAGAEGVGNPVIYLGSSTGKDGIHGASFASTGLDESSADKRPNVQIGDPFAEKLLIEATLEALQTGAVVAIQDMGAAGLTCSTIEMSAKGEVGMEIDLDLVPMREPDMTAYELMLSESQERMLCVAHQGREQEVIDVFQKWGLHAVIIGHVTAEQRLIVRRNGVVEADVYPPVLAHECPTYTTERIVPDAFKASASFDPSSLTSVPHGDALKKLLAHPNIASKRWVFRQYDQEVQTQTVLKPGEADAAVLAPRGTTKGLAISLDGNGYWTYHDPYAGGLLAVCESARNVACTGARPAGITDGLNFGNPQQGHVYWQFDECVRGIAEAAETMQTPVVSGNVSFYNESEIGEILPTAMIGMVGILANASDAIGSTIPRDCLGLGLLRTPLSEIPNGGLGASLFLSEVHGVEDGRPIRPNVAAERTLCHLLADLVEAKLIEAAHDVSEGGLAVTLTEMGRGMTVNLTGLPASSVEAALFGEFPGWVVIAYDSSNEGALIQRAIDAGIEFSPIGRSEGARLVVQFNGTECLNESIVDLLDIHAWALEDALKIESF